MRTLVLGGIRSGKSQWAETVIAAFADNPASGTLRLDGQMIDKTHLRAAKKILGQP